MTKQKYLKASAELQKVYKKMIQRKIASQDELALGMLVQIAPWCKNKWRLAQIVEISPWCARDCRIQYIDKDGLANNPTRAIRENLIILH